MDVVLDPSKLIYSIRECSTPGSSFPDSSLSNMLESKLILILDISSRRGVSPLG